VRRPKISSSARAGSSAYNSQMPRSFRLDFMVSAPLLI
jgi:hypothetical protein